MKNIMEKIVLVFKWCGNSIVTFIRTLMIFAWLFVIDFVLGDFLTEQSAAPLIRFFEYITPIVGNWEKFFYFIFLSRITYNAYQIYKHDWKYFPGGEND